VVVGDKRKTLDLVAPDPVTKQLWVAGLKHMIHMLHGSGDAAQRKQLYP